MSDNRQRCPNRSYICGVLFLFASLVGSICFAGAQSAGGEDPQGVASNGGAAAVGPGASESEGIAAEMLEVGNRALYHLRNSPFPEDFEAFLDMFPGHAAAAEVQGHIRRLRDAAAQGSATSRSGSRGMYDYQPLSTANLPMPWVMDHQTNVFTNKIDYDYAKKVEPYEESYYGYDYQTNVYKPSNAYQPSNPEPSKSGWVDFYQPNWDVQVIPPFVYPRYPNRQGASAATERDRYQGEDRRAWKALGDSAELWDIPRFLQAFPQGPYAFAMWAKLRDVEDQLFAEYLAQTSKDSLGGGSPDPAAGRDPFAAMEQTFDAMEKQLSDAFEAKASAPGSARGEHLEPPTRSGFYLRWVEQRSGKTLDEVSRLSVSSSRGIPGGTPEASRLLSREAFFAALREKQRRTGVAPDPFALELYLGGQGAN